MNGEVVICADLSNIAYKSAAAFPGLTSERRFTGGLYGFISALAKAIHATKADRVLICKDTRPYIRSKIYPEYKEARKKTRDEDLYERAQYSINLIEEMLTVTGWPLWSIPGFEFDDLCAFVATHHRHRFKKVVAMSNDSDLYQLFKFHNFLIYKGKNGVYTKQDYLKEFKNLPVDLVPKALALMGTHNDVDGIPGIGPVNATKIVTQPFRWRQTMEKHADIIERNLQLITLPHPEFPLDTPIPRPTKRYSERELLRYCGRYDINVLRDWCEAFERLKDI